MQLNQVKEHILLVFEGERTELKLYDFLKKHNLSLISKYREILTTFKAEIYQLYKKIIDEDADLFAVLQEKDANLKKISQDNISSIFLIFDYDCHASQADDNKIIELLEYFDNETENGKIFISYPMVEAFKYFNVCDNLDQFCKLTINRQQVSKFKEISHDLCQKNKTWQKMTRDEFKKLILLHCIKSNWIVNSQQTLSKHSITQQNIFNHQKTKEDIYILSAFPLILHYFYKYEDFIKLVFFDDFSIFAMWQDEDDANTLSVEETIRIMSHVKSP